MDEKRKQELGQLLHEAIAHLVILHGYRGPLSIPVDTYKRYLQERWTYYGVDFLSYSFEARFTSDVVSEAAKSNLLRFIKEELARFVDREDIPIASYLIESDSTDGYRLSFIGYQRMSLRSLIERLLEIAIVWGIEEAVSVFERCGRSEGTHGFFQDVELLKGIKLKTEVQVCEGVRLVPLPSSEISEEVTRYLPGLPTNAFLHEAGSFFGKTLLIIDRPGFTMFHEPAPAPYYQAGFPVDNLPFPVETHDLKFPHTKAMNSFKKLFCQTLSLVCDSPIQMVSGGWFLAEDQSFNPQSRMSSLFRPFNLSGSSAEAEEADIERAKCLYDNWTKFDSETFETLQMSTEQWMTSKTSISYVDALIHLGRACEAFYVTRKDEPCQQLCHRGSWYLGENVAHREALEAEFKAIYDCRTDGVHNRGLGKEVEVGEQSVLISKFIPSGQELCRKSIMKVLDDRKFPNWATLRQDMIRNR